MRTPLPHPHSDVICVKASGDDSHVSTERCIQTFTLRANGIMTWRRISAFSYFFRWRRVLRVPRKRDALEWLSLGLFLGCIAPLVDGLEPSRQRNASESSIGLMKDIEAGRHATARQRLLL